MYVHMYVCIPASLIAQLVKNLPAMQETPVWFLDQEDQLEKGKVTHSSILFFFFFNFIFKLYIIVLVLPNIKMNPPQVYMCSSWASLVAQLIKNLPTIRETWGSIPGLARSPGEGKGYPLQYSGVENSMDCIVHGVTKSQTGLSDFHFHFHVYISNWTTLNFKEKASRDFCVKWLK